MQDLQSSLKHVGPIVVACAISFPGQGLRQAFCIGSTESQPLDHQGSPWKVLILNKYIECIYMHFKNYPIISYKWITNNNNNKSYFSGDLSTSKSIKENVNKV